MHSIRPLTLVIYQAIVQNFANDKVPLFAAQHVFQ